MKHSSIFIHPAPQREQNKHPLPFYYWREKKEGVKQPSTEPFTSGLPPESESELNKESRRGVERGTGKAVEMSRRGDSQRSILKEGIAPL